LSVVPLQNRSPSFVALAACDVFHLFMEADRDESVMNPRAGCAAS
jgi:hypothetical protein